MKSLVIFSCILLMVIVAATARSVSTEGKRLIKTGELEPASWLDEDGINSLIRNKINFMDVTDLKFPVVDHDIPASKAIPDQIRFESTVLDALTKLNVPRMKAFLTQFSAFHNRYYQSVTGVESSEWLQSQVSASIINSQYRGNATVEAYGHTWAQKSVIARIEGSDPVLKSQVVILGAHLDSITSINPTNGVQPGADDNGSGSTVILETLRILLDSGIIPKRSIEFQWYAAEEVGLRGSSDIAQSYRNQGVDVVSMINYDVSGYFTPGRMEIAIHTDYTDRVLTQFLQLLTDVYLNFTWVNRTCGYACSDHAPWYEYGFASSHAAEVIVNPYMHTVNDMITRVDFVQVQELVKLAVAYSIEIAEPAENF